ncbi:MAG: hypothetical protein BGN93_02275 [Acinetobacter sp. 39-4]|nr:MAG: hypothetical protein BGN93_02275 [Acinetobacter sp. 39-4]OJU95078.1 MAG: hypothetical protein BGO19_02310 [Acinetobacter sp. 38-8]
MRTQINANLKVLKSDLSWDIKSLRSNRKSDRNIVSLITIGIAATSALTTILLGITKYVFHNFANELNALALCLSALITVITTWDGVFQHKKLWVNSAMTLNELYSLDADIRHVEANGSVDQELINQFYERYKEIKNKTNQQWSKNHED